jgi:hypothetical protein
VWSASCTRRREARVSRLSLKTKVDRVPSLGLKTGRYGLVIWASKSPRRFIGFDLKTKWEEGYWFAPQNRCADEDDVRTRVDIRLVASLRGKSGYGFPVFPQKW